MADRKNVLFKGKYVLEQSSNHGEAAYMLTEFKEPAAGYLCGNQ